MNEKEIIEEGFGKLSSDLYKKNDKLYVQYAGGIKEASKLTDEQLKVVTSIVAYEKEQKKLGKEQKKETLVTGKLKPHSYQLLHHDEMKELAGYVPRMGIVVPQVDVEEAVSVFNKFTEFKQKLLSDDDYLYIGSDGKPTTKKKGAVEYIKKSGWRKFSTVFNLDCRIIDKNRDAYEDPEGKYYVWTYDVRVTAPNGRFQDAEGVATSRDPFFTKGGKQIPEEKNIMLKAQTVGFNRAISDLIGGGAKSAEEV